MKLGAVLRLLDLVSRLVRKFITGRETSRRQEERNEIEKDSVDWLNDHFNGVPNNEADKTPSDNTNNKIRKNRRKSMHNKRRSR